MNMLLQNLLLLFLFFVVMGLLSKAKLLPLYLYLTIAEFIGPALKVEHRLAYYGIAAFLILLPAAYWILRYRQHRQEEQAALGALLATARPLYGPGGYYSQPPAAEAEDEEAEEIEVEPEPGTDEWYDYWCDR